jgi:RimJ/RimL family protein N-acetyltransferase
MGLQIRPAAPADAREIARLHLASYRAAYQDLIPAEVLSSLRGEDREQRWQASLNDPRRRTLIAEDDDAVPALIGFAEVGPSRDDDAGAGTAELMALHVTQARWRWGVGRTLNRLAIAALAAQGFQAVTLWVLTGNSRARAFYEAVGWNHDGTARDLHVWGIQVAEVRYHAACLGQEKSAMEPWLGLDPGMAR